MNDTRPKELTVGSLFSGIGGLDLGLERAGMRVKWQCEIDPYCRAVLQHHWPGLPVYEDIHDIDGSAERVDLICGGFPCQPVSLAGKGLAQKDPRWLWPEFARVVGDLRPEYVLVENVPGLAKRGLLDVLTDLAEMGFDAEWEIVSAAACGAPHLRERLFVVAHSKVRESWKNSTNLSGKRQREFTSETEEWRPWGFGGRGSTKGDVSDSHGGGLEIREEFDSQEKQDSPNRHSCGAYANGLHNPLAYAKGERLSSSVFQWEPGGERHASHCRWWKTEPPVGRVANGVPNRVAQLRALGNAVVPQVAEAVGRMILAAA